MKILWDTLVKSSSRIIRRRYNDKSHGEVRDGKLYITVKPKKGRVRRYIVEIVVPKVGTVE